MFRSVAKDFVRNFVKPSVKRIEINKKMDTNYIKTIFDNGYMGIEVPEKYGGLGASFRDSIDIIKEISKIDPTTSLLIDIQNTLIHPIMKKYASDYQREMYWHKLATTDIGCFALSEINSGSDAFSIKTKAVYNNDNTWTINGSKMWISNSYHGNYFFVFAQTDQKYGSYNGIKCFIVHRNNYGIEIGDPESKLGLKGSGTCPLYFDNCIVSNNNLIPYPGYKIAIETLNIGRIAIGAQMIGIAVGAMDITWPILQERKQFGLPIYEFQSVRHNFSKMRAEILALESLLDRCVYLYEKNENYLIEASSLKYLSGKLAQSITSECIDLVGGIGFTEDLLLAKLYRDSKIGSIYEGTNNIQLETIGKQEYICI